MLVVLSRNFISSYLKPEVTAAERIVTILCFYD